MKEILIVFGPICAGWAMGYMMGCETMVRKVKEYFAIYHAGEPGKELNLINFLEGRR